MNVFGLVMAGGGGTRFWPISRRFTPKQFLNLSGEDALINETLKRINKVINRENIFIITNEKQGEAIKKIVGSNCINKNIFYEPFARNTAPCIGYATLKIEETCKDSIICIFPSDHYIRNQEVFKSVIESGIDVASKLESIVTIGVKPTFPSTGYGYINYSDEIPVDKGVKRAYHVNEFVEKPSYALAKQYLESGNYLWNSGIFICKVSVLLDSYKRFIPRIYSRLMEIVECEGTNEGLNKRNELYCSLQPVSIDYGILERSENLVVISGEFEWNDVGSWDALGMICDTDETGNIIKGLNVSIDTRNCIMYSSGRLISTIGIDNMIVVETEDAILVCPKNRAQEVKQIVEKIEYQGNLQFL